MSRRMWMFAASLFLLTPLLITSQSAGQKGGAKPPEIVQDERAGRAIVKGQLLLTLHTGVKLDDLKPIFDRLEAKYDVVGKIDKMNHFTLAVDHDRLAELKQRLENHPYIASSSFNSISTVGRVFNDPVFKKPKDMPEDKDNWNIYRINVPDAWDITQGGAVVAVIDTGAKLDHEELTGRTTGPFSYATNSDKLQEGIVKEKRGGGKPRDEEIRNHGTHVSITIGGRADNALGTAGIAPNSPIMPLQALIFRPLPNEEAGTILGSNADIFNAIALAIDRGAGVINMSLGGVNGELLKRWRSAKTDEEKLEIGNRFLALAEDHANALAPFLDRANRTGTIVVVAAGNDNIPAEFGGYAYARRTISVAATTRDDTRAIFSNYGLSTTVSAPGNEIWSGLADPNRPYGYLNGTSMACPHAAGVVALMKTIDPGLKHIDVADILVKTGRPLETDVPIGPLLNAKAALDETRRRLKEGIRLREPQPLIPPPEVNPTLPELPDDAIAIVRGPNPWNNPNIQRIIRVWLAFADARPPAGTDPNVRWFFNRNGQAVNEQNMLTVPRPVWARFNYRWLWENAAKLESLNMGTLFEFTTGTLKLRKFDPAPTRVPEKVRPAKDDPALNAKAKPFDPGLGKTKWDGKNAKGEAVKIDFDPKGVFITHDGKTSKYRVGVNPYAHPMTIDFFPIDGGDPIRGLLDLTDLGEIALRTDFTKKRPAKIVPNDPHTFALKRTDLTTPVVAASPRGFQPDDGKMIDPRFAVALVSDGTTDCAGDCGKFAGNNGSAGPRTGIASLKMSKGVPVVGHHWVVRKFTDGAGPRQYIAKMGKDPRYTTPTFDNGTAGFIVKAREINADHIKDTNEVYAKVGMPFEQSSHTYTFVYRDSFLVTFSLWEGRRGHDFSAESSRIADRTKKLIDERFPVE